MQPRPRQITRRRFVVESAAAAVSAVAVAKFADQFATAAEAAPTHQATGVKAGEVTDPTAIVWARLTESPTRNVNGVDLRGRVDQKAPEWAEVSAGTDFTHQFALNGLKPATTYHYETETTGPDSSPSHGVLRGKFETAPLPSATDGLRFCVLTCQAYYDRDHKDGHNIYPSMLALTPQFIAFTGDNVYYDSEEPKAVTPELARYHWQRMFSLPRLVETIRNVSTYWEKDDHDTLSDDSWPGKTMGALTFAEGQRIFRQQAPLGEKPYRTFRWGRDLQIWLTDGRDFRAPNNTPDGPQKTIWGREQKEWFKRTVKASDATWKVLISPTPIVGPDRKTKNDNHCNSGFQHEGDEIRNFLKATAPDNFFVITGDRHWQYHSVHPQTGVVEFACGPASDRHASGSPGEDKKYHRFHRVKGGFLSVALRRDGARSTILFEHRDVRGKVVYSWNKSAAV